MSSQPIEPDDVPAPMRGGRYEARATHMVAAIRRQIARAGEGSVQVVRGGSQVSALVYGSSATARAESFSLEPWQSFIPTPESVIADQIDLAQTRRGVGQQVVIAQPPHSRNDTAVLAELARLGEPARYNPAVPLRLIVFDRHKAFIAIDPANTRAGAYVTTDPDIVGLACQVFLDVWQDSTLPPLELATAPPSPAPGLADQVLSGLAAGATDEAIARRIGVSARTVRRAIADLQRRYGTTSRFQLALVLAGQCGPPGPASG